MVRARADTTTPPGRIFFSHGLESGPWGSKITAMAAVARELGWTVTSLDYRGIDLPGERVRRLAAALGPPGDPAVLVGSSMGGYVALQAARQVTARGLFLLAPALYLPGYEDVPEALPAMPALVIHGWRDTVVPWEGSLRFCATTRARLMLVDDDHRLGASIAMICAALRDFLTREVIRDSPVGPEGPPVGAALAAIPHRA